MTDSLVTPKVFISYSWTSDDHVEWVVAFATRLRNDGVDVVLDQWDLIEGQDKFVFMEQMVTDPNVTKVLAICDKVYADKADGRKGGVGTESQIISKKVYDQVSQDKFIPLVREQHEGQPCLPVFFQTRIYIDFSNDDDFEKAYERLIRNLFGKPERVKPEIGKPPAHILIDSAPVVIPAQKLDRLKDAVLKGKTHTQALVQDYLDTFIDCMEQFRIVENPNDFEAFDAALDRSIETFTPFRDSFIQFISFVVDYMNDMPTRERIASFFESIAPFQERQATCRGWSDRQFDNFKFINYELFLYLIATLIKKRAYESAAYFMEHRYIVPSTLGGSDLQERGISVFNGYVASLDNIRNQRRKLNLLSVTAHIIQTRATVQRVTFKDLLQADFLLFIRGHFPSPQGVTHWYPRLSVYFFRGDPLELFVRAVTDSGLDALKTLLKIKSLPDLAIHLNRMLQDRSFMQVLQSQQFWMGGTQPEMLLNVERITGLAEKML